MNTNSKKHELLCDCAKGILLCALMSTSLYFTVRHIHESGFLEMLSIPKIDFFGRQELDDENVITPVNTSYIESIYDDASITTNITLVSLVIAGGVKTGTTSLADSLNEFNDVFYFGHETPYWTLCGSQLTENMDITSFLDAFSQYKQDTTDDDKSENGATLSQIASYLIDNESEPQRIETKVHLDTVALKPEKCNVKFFNFRWLNQLKICEKEYSPGAGGSRGSGNTSMINNKQQKYIFENYGLIIEKTPVYQQKPLISIIFSNYLPNTKVIMIARNPVKQMWSYIFHFENSIIHHGNLGYNRSKFDNNFKFSKYVWDNFFDEKVNKFTSIRNQCDTFQNIISNGSNSNSNYNYDYRKYVGRYLTEWLSFGYGASSRNEALDVESLIKMGPLSLGNSRGNIDVNEDAIIGAPMIFPSVLMYVYNYDEIYGYKNWNNFRVIQSEWLFSNLIDAMGIIKCWIQLNKEITIEHLNNNNNDIFDICPQIYSNDKEYFNNLKQRFEYHQTHKENSKTKNATMLPSDNNQYGQMFADFFNPCSNALVKLLKDRKELLFGAWIDWA